MGKGLNITCLEVGGGGCKTLEDATREDGGFRSIVCADGKEKFVSEARHTWWEAVDRILKLVVGGWQPRPKVTKWGGSGPAGFSGWPKLLLAMNRHDRERSGAS